MERFATVDDYVASFPEATRAALTQARAAIHRAVPDLVESMSYGMPTFTLDGRYLVYMAGWKAHISIYPLPSGLVQELGPYRFAKGTARFRLNQPLPVGVIELIVETLAEERASGS
ncbi:MAG: DUF1801 domain-containing protein [Actinobacteria bacterium]|nr:DUF1801 domain-containing protein [Actinomycetota bacterium]MCI0544623.1 DUF1801 domain-containing protein [Actinomycetota bacterium]MCI0679549.1 DUF1801 domain-containing protein [Actinomycetota bacterium]